ncbi:hypothetical protein [Streptomyces sp. PSKA30]|uniref:hypothetical protein n=1 Tax=Streptomyces sp. PSKA30 TaxID=2874597 RepID=UPI001CD1618D|nr:hypothetical protein [Streptomyces sp. PSKA30]MBZ9641378.1 hypothetical protein [Streptomyces sp. PSKA30]
MFTIKARDLAAILDRVAPHRFQADDDANDLDTLILDSTPAHLHAVGCSDRTLAVARTSVTGDVWTAPVGYDDATALRAWLESSDHVTVEHVTTSGHQQLRFTEGPAQITVPAACHVGRLPWRALLRLVLDARKHSLAVGRPVQLSADDLARWGHAGADGEAIEFRSLGPVGTLVTAGPDFLGLQTPHTWTGRHRAGAGPPRCAPACSCSPGPSSRWARGTRTTPERRGSCLPVPAPARSRC